MKRGLIILFIFLLGFISSISFVIAENSSIFSEFTIFGCNTNYGAIPYGSCAKNGLFYCDAGVLKDVFRDSGSCRGLSDQNEIDDCCPPEYYCNSTLSDATCVLRPYDCSKLLNQLDCEKYGCLWRSDISPNSCVDKRALQSCSDYNTNTTCIKDLYGLGKTKGLGTDICKGMYSGTKLILINSCRCIWKGTSETIGNCSLSYNITDEFDQESIFTCNKLFNSGNCSNGYQNVSWTVSNTSLNLILDNTDLIKFDCIDGTTLLSCGNSYAKLPFFDYKNFVVCILIILTIYFIGISKSLKFKKLN
jgi:hypothetical protein